jgi:hypothetical protein
VVRVLDSIKSVILELADRLPFAWVLLGRYPLDTVWQQPLQGPYLALIGQLLGAYQR